MTLGTKSILFGAHCFFLHPLAVALAWIRLFGFPWDLRLWIAFCIHDLGYHRSPNMDGDEGEQHVWLGSKLMWSLFDKADDRTLEGVLSRFCDRIWGYRPEGQSWAHFCLFHSRSFAKRFQQPVSRLCVADKLAFAVMPRWLYLPMVTSTGEIHEYLENAQATDASAWHQSLRIELLRWVARYQHTQRRTLGRVDRDTCLSHNVRSRLQEEPRFFQGATYAVLRRIDKVAVTEQEVVSACRELFRNINSLPAM